MRRAVEEMLARPVERPRLYTYEATAKLLSVAPRTVARMVACGELLPVKLRGKCLIPAEEIDRVSTPKPRAAEPERRPRFDPEKFRADLKKARGA